MPNSPKKIAVIDGNSLMHRAYHAVPPTMNAPDGTPTNAVFGFMSMFLKLYETHDAPTRWSARSMPEGPRFAWRRSSSTRRPVRLWTMRCARNSLIESLLESMNVPVVRIKGWEGDDVLGSIAAMDEALGY